MSWEIGVERCVRMYLCIPPVNRDALKVSKRASLIDFHCQHHPTMSSIGPQLPPHLQASSSRPPVASTTTPPDSDSEDDYAPALPPSLAAQRGIGPSLPPSASAGPSRGSGPAVGPALPSRAYEDDDDSEEEVGPSLGEATRAGEAGSGVREFMEREARWAKEREVRVTLDLLLSSNLALTRRIRWAWEYRKLQSPNNSSEKNGC